MRSAKDRTLPLFGEGSTRARLKIDKLMIDPEVQQRAALLERDVEEYVEAYERGDALPPVIVYRDDEAHYLADGFHRVQAAKRYGRTEIDAEIRNGARDDAILFACSANATHGVKRTNADKRQAVQTMLSLRPSWSDAAIARHCTVSGRFVGLVRASTLNGSESDAPVMREGKDGRAINVTRIGKRAPTLNGSESDERAVWRARWLSYIRPDHAGDFEFFGMMAWWNPDTPTLRLFLQELTRRASDSPNGRGLKGGTP